MTKHETVYYRFNEYLAINGVPKCESRDFHEALTRHLDDDNVYNILKRITCSYRIDTDRGYIELIEAVLHAYIPGSIITWMSPDEHSNYLE